MRTRAARLFLFALSIALLLTLHARPGVADETGRERIQSVRSWAYQLEGPAGAAIDLPALANSRFDLLVVDRESDGVALTREDVKGLQRKPDGSRRVVLAYISIGEAEEYRYYWKREWNKRPPAFLAAQNKEWSGNYKVRYWHPAWRRILLGGATGKGDGYVDRIIDAGFDGVYMDIVDAFEYFGPEGEAPERKTAAPDMCALIEYIARHARKTRKRPNFLIVPQNGANILDELTSAGRKRYLATVDAIGAEDTFYFGDRKEDNPLDIQRDTLAALKRFRAAGRPVFAVDYLRKRRRAKKFVALAREHGFVPYVGVRALDRVVKQPE